MLKWVVFCSFVIPEEKKENEEEEEEEERERRGKRKGNKVGGKQSVRETKREREPLTRSQVRLERLTFPSFSGRRTLNADYDDTSDDRGDFDSTRLNSTLARYAQTF